MARFTAPGIYESNPSPHTESKHECLIQSFRARNDTENRGIIIARQIINAALIYVVSSIAHNNGFRGSGQNGVSGAHSNIASGTFNCFATTRPFNCTTPSESLRISQKTGKNRDCRHKKNRNHENTLS